MQHPVNDYNRAPHLLCCRALEVQEVRLRTRTPRIYSTL